MITLKDWVEGLRAELTALSNQADTDGVHFRVGPVELETQIVSAREQSGRGGAKFWVVDGSADHKRSHSQTQTLKITLTPTGPHDDVLVKDDPSEFPD
jgi:hypothetical protein